jgi:hypothetical protein
MVALALKAARVQTVDRVTVEVVTALREAGIRALVIKGPVFARWLYGDGALRSYDDSDLLVAPDDVAAASHILRSLDFELLVEPSDAYAEAMGPKHAYCWKRGAHDGQLVDLHDSLAGAEADKEIVWAALSRETESIRVGGIEIEATGPAANAVIVALHAAMNGPTHEGSVEDLTRALTLAGFETWSAAADLAREIGAEEVFAAGLRMLPPGRPHADDLQLAQPASVEALLRAGGAPDGAVFLDHLSATESWRGRLRLFARALVPDRSYMRYRYPIARRGPAGLAAAYALRAARRLVGFVPALLALVAARSEARESSRPTAPARRAPR